MSQFYQYNWQVASLNAIALPQTFVTNVPLQLNGAFGNLPNNQNTMRAIGVSCAGNVSATVFTAVGTQNGVAIVGTANVPGNGAGNTYPFLTNNVPAYFDTITSITPNQNNVLPGTITVGTISAALATPAYSIPFLVNTENQPYLTYSVVLNSLTAVGTIYGSLIDISQSGLNYNQLIASGVLTKIAPIAANTLVQINAAIKNIVVQITNETALIGIQFLQV